MIKIYDRPFAADPKDDIYYFDITDIRYNFYEDADKLYVEIFVNYESEKYEEKSGSYQIAIDKKLYAGEIMMVTLTRPNLSTIYTKIIFSTKYSNLHGNVYSPKLFPKLFNAVSIIMPKDYINDAIMIMPHMRTKIDGNQVDGCEYEEVELIDKDPQTTLINLSEEASIKRDAWLLEKQCITPLIDPYESAAYLEGQVDVLSKIVKLLIEKTGLDIGEYKEIMDSIDSNSLIGVKPLDIINSDIIKDKGRVREVQKKYYSAKYGQV